MTVLDFSWYKKIGNKTVRTFEIGETDEEIRRSCRSRCERHDRSQSGRLSGGSGGGSRSGVRMTIRTTAAAVVNAATVNVGQRRIATPSSARPPPLSASRGEPARWAR